MKKLRYLFILFVMFCMPMVANAAGEYEFGFKMVKCDPNASGMTAAKCRNNYLNGSLDSYIIENNGDLEPGSVVMLVAHLKVGTPKTAIAFQTTINYDTKSLAPLMTTDRNGETILLSASPRTTDFPYYETENDDGDLVNDTDWSTTINKVGDSVVIVTDAGSGGSPMPLTKDLGFIYLFFEVSETAAAGSSVSVSYDGSAGVTEIVDDNASKLAFKVSNNTYSIYGTQSSDYSLGTLTVTNNSITYPLSPVFVPGDSSNLNYTAVVPSTIDKITLSATANDAYATVSPVNLKEHTLNVGENKFNILVTAQNGDNVTYVVNVYRLSDDATLSNINLTNSISVGSITNGVYTYTASIPYSTKSTYVTATPKHANAFVESGTGDWTFANSGSTVNTKNIVVKAENCNEQYKDVVGNTCTSLTYTLNITREAASENGNLSSLVIKNGDKVLTLDSEFNKDDTTYDLGNVSNDTLTLNVGATVEDTGKASITEGLGNHDLKVGDNEIKVVVKAEDGSEKTYTINVRRLSNDVLLSNLEVTSNPLGTLSPKFEKNFNGEYTYTYDSTVTDITITATVNDVGNAKVSIVDISDGSVPTAGKTLDTVTETFGNDVTKVAVVVTAEDGTLATYNVNLNRLKSSNNYLSSLKLNDGTKDVTLSPSFVSGTRTYSATVGGEVTSVSVDAVTAVTYAEVVEIKGNTNLQFGANIVEVVVKAEDGTQASYIVNLTREKYTIATLDNLTVNGVTIPGFVAGDDTKLEYTLDNVPFETESLTIGATETNEYSNVTGLGNIPLNPGDNAIKVVVTSHDGNTTKEYIINVYRELNDDNTVHGITVSGIVPTLNAEGKYEVTLPNNKTTLNPADVIVSASDDAVVTKGETISLSTKNVNTYTFEIKAQNGDVEEYTILVTRTKSNDVSISRVNLTIGSDSSRYCLMEGDSCTINVPVDTTEFKLEAIMHPEAVVTPENGVTHTMSASESSKPVTLTVTAEDGTTKVYTLNVERQKSSNNDLSSLEVNGASVPSFVVGQQIYNVSVAGTVEEVTVSAEVVDTGKSTIVTDLSQPFALQFGSNQIDVVVRAENGQEKTFTVFVTRAKKVDATLKDLKVNGVTISGFESGTTEYTYPNVGYDVTSLEIVATPNDSLASATVVGATGSTVTLNTTDNVIEIVVTAHDTNVKKTYKINVYREQNEDNSVHEITIMGSTPTLNDEGKYEITVPNDKTELTPEDIDVKVGDGAVVTKGETISLSTKDVNEYTFEIKSENGDVEEYTILVTRTKSNDTTISRVNLTIGTDSSRFCLMEGNSCTINVPVDTTEFKLEAIMHPEATVTPENGVLHTMGASESNKTVILTVTAEDGTIATYTLNVERQKSSNNDLSSLEVNGVSVPSFVVGQQIYNVSVEGTVEEVVITAEVFDTGKSTIVTDLSKPFSLQFGSNQIDVIVRAENGQEKTFTVFVTRAKNVDASLKDLTINGVQITGFESGTTEYTYPNVGYSTTGLNVVATPNDSLASATINGGTNSLVTLNTTDNTITIVVTAHDGVTQKTYTIDVYREQNNDTSLDGITLSGLTATYNPATGNYEVTVPNNVTAIDQSNLVVDVNEPLLDKDPLANYTFANTDLVTTNENIIPITVTAEDGTIKVYNLVVTRTKSSIATLDEITVTNGSFSPSFNKNTKEYSVTVPVETTEFDVNAVLTEPNAKIISGVTHYTMTESNMSVEIVVVSEDGLVTETYTLNISRTKSSDNTLSNITVKNGDTEYVLSPEFNKNTFSYVVNVPGDVEKVTVLATKSDNRAEILSGTGEKELNVGDNNVVVRVKSESGAETEYTVKVVRAKKFNNNLSSLTITSGSETLALEFDKDTTTYTLDDVPYSTTSIKIEAGKEDSDATVSGTGNKTLVTGPNSFDIVVTAQDGSKKTYTINVNRAKNNDATLNLLSIDGYTLSPDFSSGVTQYELTVDATKETLDKNDVTAIATDSNAKVVKGETINLSTTSDNFYEIKVIAEDGVTEKTYTIKVIRPKSSDATLSNVKLTGATLSPSFNKDKTEYTITVPYGSTSFEIEGIPTVSTTVVTGNDTYSSTTTTVTLSTVAEDGVTTKTYTFNVVAAASNDATLSALSIDGYPLDKVFETTTLSYSIGNIPNGTTQLKVNATSTNALSDVKYYVDGVLQDSNIINIPAGLGTKVITIKVTAADGITTKTYDIEYTIIKSSNFYLRKLTPSIGTLEFNKTTYSYEISVDNSVTSIGFDVETEDSNAKITVKGETSFTPKTITLNDLQVGSNLLEILVTAEDGTKKTYTVNVKRLEATASSDAYLSSLSVNGYPFDKTFKMETLEYSIGSIPFALETITINTTPNMGSSKISYLVNGVKQNSNVISIPKVEGIGAITVQVTAEDGVTVKNYKISYSKTASTNAYLSNIIVSEGVPVPTFNKETYSYEVNVGRDVNSIDITAIKEDNTSIMKMNGNVYSSPHTLTISPLSSGNTEVTIVVTAENGNVLTYKVVIKKEADVLSTITSVEYGHSIVNGYVKTTKLGATALDMKNQLDNENEYLEIWTADESRKVEDNETLATGMIIKLIIDGQEKDRKYIVIKGDTNGDGEIDLFDAVMILNHYLEKTFLSDAYMEAAYVNEDEDIDLFDSVKILNHYLERELLH